MEGLLHGCGGERTSNSRLAAKEVAAAWVGRANQQETRAALVAAWREGWIGFGRWRACG